MVALRTTMGRVAAGGVLVALAACASAQAADRIDPVPGPSLPGSETLAAAAAHRADALCDAGPAGLRPDPSAYGQETWAEVTEQVGRARIPSSAADEADPDAARAEALDEVRAGWRADAARPDGEWDRAETASVACADGHLYAVEVLARSPHADDAGDFGRTRAPADAVTHLPALRYGTAVDVTGTPVDLLLDLFLPPDSLGSARPTGAAGTTGAATRPTLVLVHGGGFTAGSRAAHQDDAVAWARRGFVVATIDYRVDPDAGDSVRSHRAAAFAALDDGMEAIRWLRAHADEHGIDPDRIAALGASAGGEIALGLALLEDLSPDGPLAEVSAQPAAAFSTGAYLTPVLGAASLEASDAPVLLQHFETDTASGRHWTYAAATCDAVRSAGGTCDLALSEGSDHTVGLGPDSAEIDRILAFLAVHLRLDG